MQVRTLYVPTAEVDPTGLPTGLDSATTLVLVFSGLAAAEVADPVLGLRQAFPEAIIVGCSTAGEVLGATVRDGGISIAVARFERTRLSVARAEVAYAGASYAAGVDLARQLRSPDLSGVLVYSDGLNVNGSQLLQGLNRGLPEHVVVTGGLAADGGRFAATWVVAEDRPSEGMVVAVGLYGDALLMRADIDRLVDGAALASAETAAMGGIVGECLVVAISGVGRRLVLKERVEEELEVAVEGLPDGAQLVGFYSYGEISPLASGRCELPNQTMTLTALTERPA